LIDLETDDLPELQATMSTSKGDMIIRFRPDHAPEHVRNFAKLAQDGFYDGLAFHRIIRNFMIQGGCPHTRDGATGTPGTGGPGHTIDAEFNELEHRRGALSMARSSDPNSAGSQFFIVHGQASHLDGKYSAFGFLESGFDTLDRIAGVPVGPPPEGTTPLEPVRLHYAVLLPVPKT
jgi:peptidyl-prolyl cis-trans isomerase B (cyclophilin B)